MVARAYNSSNQYRFGYNGKEQDSEGMGGSGATYDYGFRIYNPNIARFLSVDPLTKSYPFYTPYQFAGNKPIMCTDLDGLEEVIRIEHWNTAGELLSTQIILVNNDAVRYEVKKIWDVLHGTGIKPEEVNAKGQPERFNIKNAFFQPEGWELYKKGSYTKGGLNIPPLKGQLTVKIIDGFYNFDYSPIVNKDDHYNAASEQWGLGQAYDIAASFSNGGTKLTAVGTGTMAVGVVVPVTAPIAEPTGAILTGAGKALSTTGDVIEVGADMYQGLWGTAASKAAFTVVPNLTLGKLLPQTKIPENGQKIIENTVSVGTDQVKNAAFSGQQKPSAQAIKQKNVETLQQLH